MQRAQMGMGGYDSAAGAGQFLGYGGMPGSPDDLYLPAFGPGSGNMPHAFQCVFCSTVLLSSN